MGGKPSKGTGKDMRLAVNKPKSGKASKAQSKPMPNQPPIKKGN